MIMVRSAAAEDRQEYVADMNGAAPGGATEIG